MSFTCVKNNLADAMKKNPPDSLLLMRIYLATGFGLRAAGEAKTVSVFLLQLFDSLA